jgi:HD superfamily phosphohydrolase
MRWKKSVEDVHHEEISLLFMHQLNVEFNGVNLAIQVFEGIIIENLCCSLFQPLDMDRMDYLKRDSFYSGVAEEMSND